MHSNRVSKRSSGLRGVRGQGLACGSNYSCGCGDAAVNPTPSSSCGCSSNLGAAPAMTMPTAQSRFNTVLTPVRAGAPMTFQPPSTVSPLSFFREGLAFGAAWAASLEQGRTVPAQWHHDLERAALNTAIPVSPTGEAWSNRAAFVAGFDLGIRIILENRTSLTAPNGRNYTRDFLRTQGTVAANNLFGQARPAILPAIAGPTGMAPASPGVVTRPTYDQLVDISRRAQMSNLRSLTSASGMTLPVGASPSLANWIMYVMGQPARVPTTVSRAEWQALRDWANLKLASSAFLNPVSPYFRAILNTTWVPQNTGRTYYSSVGSR